MKTRDYSYFLTRVAGLMGMSADDLQDDEKANLNGFFNRAIRDGWERTNWPDLCPYGEARFIGNMLRYAYEIDGLSWLLVGLLDPERNATGNPLDGRETAVRLVETTDNSTHGIRQNMDTPLSANSDYTLSGYIRPAGRQYCQLAFTSENGEDYSAYFSLIDSGAVVSTNNCTATITQAANGFYLCAISFTTPESTSENHYYDSWCYISQNGTTTTYYGSGALGYGLFVWGFYLGSAKNAPKNAVLPYSQTGAREIECLFNAWQSQPTNLRLPVQARYSLVTDGIQFYSNAGTIWYPWTPSLQNMSQTVFPAVVFIYYRLQCPQFIGEDYSDSSTYDVDDQVYFVDSDGAGNYWKCIVQTALTQSPETTPDAWELLEIPAFLFDFIVYKSYSDWLRIEGQQAKAQLNADNAEEIINGEFDKMERQQGFTMQTKMQTHLTSQPN